MANNGGAVAAFERAFSEYVGAKYAVALCNGTGTLHTALVALGVQPGDRVAVPPLTMASTTIAVLHAGAVPVFCDVDPNTWLLNPMDYARKIRATDVPWGVPVSLYGLHYPTATPWTVDDAAQTLRTHSGCAFTSYSFQASKILALGEGGMLVTDDEELATKAREFSSLGYRMRADQPRIDPAALKSPTFERHHALGYNYRMSDLVARDGLHLLTAPIHSSPPQLGFLLDCCIRDRRACAVHYREAIAGCDWLTPQHVPDGSTHDYWTFAVACDTPQRALWLADAVVRHGGEQPYPAWRLTFDEPAFRHLDPGHDMCHVARSLQPRLLQFQCNNLQSAEGNALALRHAIEEVGA